MPTREALGGRLARLRRPLAMMKGERSVLVAPFGARTVHRTVPF
jgi:hypothetical protein